MGTLTPQTKSLAGIQYTMQFQAGSDALFMDGSGINIYQLAQAIITLLTKD